METNKLLSNENYSLSELFSTQNRKIIIPDFQRDYCWGDESHGEKKNKDIVSDFLNTLFDEFNNNKSEILLGKIDAYENPTNHIYLTDGQQRLTTLYLLIGMLHKKFGETCLKKCLISDFEELQDDQEPYLQYAVRETTVFFLRDLVNEFFIKKNELKVSDVKNQNWFFNEYSLDPSIRSMLSALEIIEKKSADLTSDICHFVIENIKIQYYNVEDKKHGEERFVIINTTGKSLTVSENIKPILLGNTQNSELAIQWEERETWFWKNKKKDENISDNGVNDFLTWYFKVKKQQEDIDIIKESKSSLRKNDNEENLNNIHIYFQALKNIISLLGNEKFQDQFKFINDNKNVSNIIDLREFSRERQQNILLPLLAFISKFGLDTESAYQFLRRLRKNYFDLRKEHRKQNYIDWRYVLQIIEKSNTLEQIFTFETNENTISRVQNILINNWYNDEEKIKSQLSENKNLLSDWEDHPDFMGYLSPLFNIAGKDIYELKDFYNVYLKIDPKKFTYSCNPKLGNFYRLMQYLNDGYFEHRTIAGWGYSMRVNSEKELFLYRDFNEIWRNFKCLSEDEILVIYEEQLIEFFKTTVLKHNKNVVDLEDLLKDIRKIGHYERVLLWSILEFLDNEKEIFFDGIAQYWEYPNLINIVEENNMSFSNDYSIGNLLLGTSYEKKRGEFDYQKFPLMKMLHNKKSTITKSEIEENTTRITQKLKTLI